MAERWLLISYWANVEGMAPSFHVDDRLPHLEQAGLDVEVLTSVCGPRPQGRGGRWHRVPTCAPSGYRYEVRYLVRALPEWAKGAVKVLLTAPAIPFYAVEKAIANLDSTFWWWLPSGLAGLWQTRRRRPDLVYSTGGPLSAHLAAAWIARWRGVPWIAEIRDPLLYQFETRGRLHRRVVAWAESMIHRRADGVVYLTRIACARAQARAGGRCTAIYAGGEMRAPVDSASRTRSEFRMVHAGSLAGTRNPGPLLAALTSMVAKRPELRGEIRLTLIGAMDGAARRMVAEFAYPEMVEAVAKLPRGEALAKVAEADVLLVIQNTDAVSGETIPSKTYDYLVAGRPVLGLLHQNPELAGLLREAGHTAVEIGATEEIAAAVGELHRQWKAGQLRARPDLRFTRAGATETFVAWAREVAPARLRPEEARERTDER